MPPKNKVTFRRIRGRIVPIRSSGSRRKSKISFRSEKAAAKEILRKGSGGIFSAIGGASVLGLGGLFGAGRLDRTRKALEAAGKGTSAARVAKLANLTKFGSIFGAGLIAANALSRLDKKTKRDEKSKLFNLGNKSGATNIAIGAGLAFLGARLGKRFQRFGQTGKFPIKLRDI